MLNIGIQFFGGRGGGGSGGARGGGRAGGGGAVSGDEARTAPNMNTSTAAELARETRREIREIETDMLYNSGDHSNGWYRTQQGAVEDLTRQLEYYNRTVAWGSNPASAPVGATMKMGGYTFVKTPQGDWTATKNGKRYDNRTNADIKRVFT